MDTAMQDSWIISTAFVYTLVYLCAAVTLLVSMPTPPRRFPKGHIREYDPTGEFVYKDQNPKFK